MKEEVKSKKSSKKLIIAIAVIVVIAAIVLAFYQGIFSLPTGLAAAQTTGSQVAPQTTQTGTISSNQETRNLPYYESVDLQVGRYLLEFNSDTPVWVFILNEDVFNKWKSTGAMSFVVAGTGNKEENKVKSFTQTFIAPQDVGSTFYIVIQGAEKAAISYKITRE